MGYYHSFERKLIQCLFTVSLLFIFVQAASDSGDVDDWQDVRGYLAAIGMFLVINCESPGLFNNEDEPIMTSWVWCMMLIGAWTVYGICQ
jgi:hypothetical protein